MAAVLVGLKEVLVVMIVTAIVVLITVRGRNAGEFPCFINPLICKIPEQVLN